MANKITPRTESVVLYQGDHEAALEALRAEVAADRERQGARTADDVAAEKRRAESLAQFAADMVKHGVTCRLRQVDRRAWSALVRANPPREGNRMDALAGLNEEDFAEALLRAKWEDRASGEVTYCLEEPVFDSDEERDAFLDGLTVVNFNKLYDAALKANGQMGGVDPKEFARFATSQDAPAS